MKKIFVLSFVIFLLMVGIACATDLTVSWTNPDDTRVTGIYVYHGSTLAAVEDKTGTQVDVLLPDNSVVITDLTPGNDFYVGATSHDDTGTESAMSDIIHTVVPEDSQVIEIPAKPSEIRLIFQ